MAGYIWKVPTSWSYYHTIWEKSISTLSQVVKTSLYYGSGWQNNVKYFMQQFLAANPCIYEVWQLFWKCHIWHELFKSILNFFVKICLFLPKELCGILLLKVNSFILGKFRFYVFALELYNKQKYSKNPKFNNDTLSMKIFLFSALFILFFFLNWE